jgi:hypothetical protein
MMVMRMRLWRDKYQVKTGRYTGRKEAIVLSLLITAAGDG